MTARDFCSVVLLLNLRLQMWAPLRCPQLLWVNQFVSFRVHMDAMLCQSVASKLKVGHHVQLCVLVDTWYSKGAF